MSRLILITFLVASVALITSCEKKQKGFQASLLEKSWTQSFEEKTSDDIEIYRPSDYKEFPIARYRQVFSFHDNNVCEYLMLAENDAHYMEKGKWEFDDKPNIIKVLNSDSEIIYEFEIVGLTDELLKLKLKK